MLYPAELRARTGKHLILNQITALALPQHLSQTWNCPLFLSLSKASSSLAASLQSPKLTDVVPFEHETPCLRKSVLQRCAWRTSVIVLEERLRVGTCIPSAGFVGR